jgi:uncharacterized protein (TIGR03435 family)
LARTPNPELEVFNMTPRLLASIAIAGVVAVLVFGQRDIVGLRAQSQTLSAPPPSFEVASIKQNKSGDGRVLLGFPPGGRFTATNVPLRALIAAAYGTPQPLPNFRIIGGPSWIDSDRFDINAKSSTDFQPGTNGPPAELFAMLKTLLIDRFKLMAHTEQRELPVYYLVLARTDGKIGSQLKKSDVDCAALFASRRGGGGPPPPPPQPGERLQCGMFGSPGRITGGSVNMVQLSTLLSRLVNRDVVDKTGLAGNFDVDLTFTPDQPARAPGAAGDQPIRVNGIDIDPNGPSIFTALQEQLGLKLDSQKAPVDVIVIDSVEHPSED